MQAAITSINQTTICCNINFARSNRHYIICLLYLQLETLWDIGLITWPIRFKFAWWILIVISQLLISLFILYLTTLSTKADANLGTLKPVSQPNGEIFKLIGLIPCRDSRLHWRKPNKSQWFVTVFLPNLMEFWALLENKEQWRTTLKDKSRIKKKCIPLLKCSKKKEIRVFENAQKM